MDFNETLRQAYFAGVTNGDWFPRGNCIGIYCPDWDSQFNLTSDGITFMNSVSNLRANLFKGISIKSRAVRILKAITNDESMHEIRNRLSDKFVFDTFADLDGSRAENFEFCATVTWLLQNKYIFRVIDKSI
jgi:hypothetical protein